MAQASLFLPDVEDVVAIADVVVTKLLGIEMLDGNMIRLTYGTPYQGKMRVVLNAVTTLECLAELATARDQMMARLRSPDADGTVVSFAKPNATV